MPGRSWTFTSLCPLSFPSFLSTVTPGQLPTYWELPVRSLNIVVLPQFGLPARATLIDKFVPPPFLLPDFHHLGVYLA